ncbi:MAG: ArsS family sensor histidine kinase [Sulfuricurvum sp.]
MNSRFHSVFFKLHSFFALAIAILVLLFISVNEDQKHKEFRMAMHRSMELADIVRLSQYPHSCMGDNDALIEAGFKLLGGEKPLCRPLPLPPPLHERLRHRTSDISIFYDGSGFIYQVRREHCVMYYRDLTEGKTAYFVWGIFLVLLGGLLALYLVLWNNLKPLKELYERIRLYGEGKEIAPEPNEGKDEIAMIDQAFYEAHRRQNRLKRSRELFLRNIMHELKTPIAKGKLIVELETPSANMTLLSKLFLRLEHLITQMAEVEKMHAFALQPREVLLDTLIETAIERLLIDPALLNLQGCHRVIHVDPEWFTSALQNLIDNAYRHADAYPVDIVCDENRLCIQNLGKPLSRPVEEAFEAFVTEKGSGGLGLGLYIARSVCELHRLELSYRYENGVHYFCMDIRDLK